MGLKGAFNIILLPIDFEDSSLKPGDNCPLAKALQREHPGKDITVACGERAYVSAPNNGPVEHYYSIEEGYIDEDSMYDAWQAYTRNPNARPFKITLTPLKAPVLV